MDSKLSILLLFTIVAQSSLALDSSVSCSSRTTGIGGKLATIQFGIDVPYHGLERVADVVYTEIRTLLAVICGRQTTTPKEAKSKLELTRAQANAGLLDGFGATYGAIKVYQTELDVDALVTDITNTVTSLNDNFILGVRAAVQSKTYHESQAGIKKYKNAVLGGGATLIGGLLTALLNGTKTIPDEAQPMIACVEAQAVSAIRAAVTSVFDEISTLAKARFDTNGCTATYDKYASKITAAHKKAVENFSAEVLYKFSILENLVKAEYLNKRGIVTGLFDIQSTRLGKKFV